MMSRDLVQIHAEKEEMAGRIEAFCSRKRQQINESNIRTFCGVGPEAMEFSCARIDAVHFPLHNRSRFKVTSVNNQEGPQLKDEQEVGVPDPIDVNRGANIIDRIREMEEHCNVYGGTDESLMERVKRLEERILRLEGVSLEYFNPAHSLHTGHTPSHTSDGHLTSTTTALNNSHNGTEELSLDVIDERIDELKRKLRTKALHVQASEST